MHSTSCSSLINVAAAVHIITLFIVVLVEIKFFNSFYIRATQYIRMAKFVRILNSVCIIISRLFFVLKQTSKCIIARLSRKEDCAAVDTKKKLKKHMHCTLIWRLREDDLNPYNFFYAYAYLARLSTDICD